MEPLQEAEPTLKEKETTADGQNQLNYALEQTVGRICKRLRNVESRCGRVLIEAGVDGGAVRRDHPGTAGDADAERRDAR